MRRALLLIFVAVAVASPFRAGAQDETYKFDFGGGIGMSGYLGDVNESNMFRRPGFAAQLSGRYLFNSRWAVRALLSTASLSGNSEDFDMVFPGNATYSFHSQVWDLGVRGEVNFLNYGIGETYKRLSRWSPYLAVGIGLTMSSINGGSSFAPSLPMAFGVKYKLGERLNLSAEWAMTKVFGDKVDSRDLTDLFQIKSSFGKNTDWFTTILISITYEFGKRCSTCHYVD